MARLLAFAEENRRRAIAGLSPWHFWGNVRFDASWTPDRIELLAFSGLVAVSGGIEVATEKGLAMTDKGFDLAGLVRTLVAFRRAGILVHAYLIYGFPGQDEADIVESAEFVRGLFATGLVDSAFWHRFVLTRHSRMLAEWREGGRPTIEPIDRGGSFAANDLEFVGEKDFDRYGEGLDAALGAWMEGEGLDRPAAEWMGLAKTGQSRADKPRGGARSHGQTHASTAASSGFAFDGPRRVEDLIVEAETALDARPLSDEGHLHWIAGLPMMAAGKHQKGEEPGNGEGGGRVLRWAFRGDLEARDLGTALRATRAASAISRLARIPGGVPLRQFAEESGLKEKEISDLRTSGLVILP